MPYRTGKSRSKGIPKGIWALGFVSMFMDISSEMIHSLLPVFLVSVLGSSALFVGLIEGVAEATAMITKTFSGALSDWLGKRKVLVLAGYGLGTLTKPLFAMATGVTLVFGARFLDRVGKGIRGAPRDALIADLTPTAVRGAAYGLRQSLDTVGAFIGPLLAMGLMIATADNFRSVFWVAVVPGLTAVAILAIAVHEPAYASTTFLRRPIRINDVLQLGSAYWMVVAFGSVFTLARFSEAFILLRAESVGVHAGMIPLIMVVMNVVFALTAYPVGHLSDRIGRTGLIAAGLAALILADLILAMSVNGWEVAAGTVFWGLHMGLTQGLLSALVADTAGRRIRGTAFGVFNMACGIAMLAASLIAGLLWDAFGPPAAFIAGTGFAAASVAGYLALRHRLVLKPTV